MIRISLVALVLLSQTGCVAAIPMIAQIAMDPHSSDRFCSMMKIPGQTTSFCDRTPVAGPSNLPLKAPNGQPMTTAAR